MIDLEIVSYVNNFCHWDDSQDQNEFLFKFKDQV